MSQTTNLLQNLQFKLVLKRTPNVDFFSKSINIPSISIPFVAVANPFTVIKEQGDHITYNPLSVTFNIDENMENYKEIVRWMTEIGFPENWDQYKNDPKELEGASISDLDVYLFTSKSNPKHLFSFKNAWPTDLSDININIENETVTYAECTVTFEYDFFDVT